MEFFTKEEAARKMELKKESQLEAHAAKSAAANAGYTYQISLYGVLTGPEAEHHEYRRIEVINSRPWTSQDVALIYNIFRDMKPAKTYTLYVYDPKNRTIAKLGGWD